MAGSIPPTLTIYGIKSAHCGCSTTATADGPGETPGGPTIINAPAPFEGVRGFSFWCAMFFSKGSAVMRPQKKQEGNKPATPTVGERYFYSHPYGMTIIEVTDVYTHQYGPRVKAKFIYPDGASKALNPADDQLTAIPDFHFPSLGQLVTPEVIDAHEAFYREECDHMRRALGIPKSKKQLSGQECRVLLKKLIDAYIDKPDVEGLGHSVVDLLQEAGLDPDSNGPDKRSL